MAVAGEDHARSRDLVSRSRAVAVATYLRCPETRWRLAQPINLCCSVVSMIKCIEVSVITHASLPRIYTSN